MSVFVEAPAWSVDLVGRAATVDGGRVLTTVTAVDGSQVLTALEPGRGRCGDEVAVLPVTGEVVTVADGQAVIRGCWVGLIEDPCVVDGRLEALVLCESVLRVVRVAPAQVDARRVVDGRAPEGERVALGALLGEAQAHRHTERADRVRLERLICDAHEWADDNELCARFDDFMDAHDLPRRSREYDLRVEVSATVRLTRTATNADDAADCLTREEVFAAVGALGANDISWEAEEDY